jgi:hypothetical protein
VRTKARESERLSFAQNPASGTMLAAPAGGQAEAEFDFYNDSPDVASFYLEVEGLGPEWAAGVGTAYESWAAASGGGQLRLTLTPPLMAAVGEYDFKVLLMSGGAPVNDGTALILRVDPPLEQPVAAAVPPPPVEPVREVAPPPPVEANGTSAVVSPPPVEEPTFTEPVEAKSVSKPRARPAAKPKPVEPAPVAEVVPEPVKAVEPEPVIPVAKVVPPPVETPPPPKPEPVIPTPTPVETRSVPPPSFETRAVPPPSFEQRSVPPPSFETRPVQQTPVIDYTPPPVTPTPVTPTPQPRPTTPQPQPRPVQQTPIQQEAPPPITPTPQPTPSRPVTPTPTPPPNEEPVLVDYNPRGTGTATQAFDDDEHEEEIAEQFLLDPKDGTLIPLRPGEKMLLRFPFINDAPRERTYILDEDRALEDGWLTLVQDQVNLTRNGQGELSVRLMPPINADPGDYPFTITTGPQGGQLLPRVLTLSVLATPAVQLTAKAKTIKIGPFPLGTDVVFPISVESAGNADTAFRISVKTPQNEATDGVSLGPGDIYESGPWRYLFDKEMETLRSPMAGQPPRPIPITLRVRRRGPWWFGAKEQHQFRVAAVPVTEPDNGGKTGNSLELTAVRSRPWLFPWPFWAALALMFALFQSGGPADFSVTDAAYSNGSACWIVSPKDSDNKQINMSWTSKSLALLRFTGSPQGQEDKPTISTSKMFSGSYTGTVPVSTDHRDVIYHYRLSRWFGGADQDITAHFIYTRTSTPLQVTNGTTHGPLPGGSDNVTLTVPASGYARLDIKNMATQENRLDWWLVKGLDDNSANKFAYIKSNGSLEPGATEHFLIQRNSSSSSAGSDEQIVLITTDANHPVLTVTLKAAQ